MELSGTLKRQIHKSDLYRQSPAGMVKPSPDNVEHSKDGWRYATIGPHLRMNLSHGLLVMVLKNVSEKYSPNPSTI